MTPAPRLRSVKRAEYKPVLSDVERRAYAAAHRIMCEQTIDVTLACAGSRRSRQADAIASIIIESLGGERVTWEMKALEEGNK